MAKLTAEQKEANKARVKLRDAAFRARRTAYSKALEDAKQEAMKSEQYKAMEKANSDHDEALKKRDEMVSELRDKIFELEQQIKNVPALLNLDGLNEKRITKNKIYFSNLREIENLVKARFPDVCDVFSSSQWEQLGHFKPE